MSRASAFDINAKLTIFANVYLCTLPALVIIFLPMLVGGLIENLGLNQQDAGYVVTLDMLGYTVGTIASFFFIHRANWRYLALGCIVMMALVNGLSAHISDYYTLLGARFASGFCGGVLTAVTFAVMGQMRDPDSAYGWWLVFQAAFGVVGFKYFWVIGVSGGFIALAVMLVLGGALFRFIPEQALKTEQAASAGEKRLSIKAVAGVLAILLVYVGLMTEYTYLERIGNAGGLSPDDIGTAFSAMSIAGLVGGGAAAKLGANYGRLLPVVFGVLGCVVSFYLLSSTSISALYFAISCCVYFGFWSFLLPYLVGACAAVDVSGRLLSLANAAIGAGLAFGPFIAANLINEGSFVLIAVVATAFLTLGFALIVPLLKESQRKDRLDDKAFPVAG
ncbi:MFS transporter [Pseudomonas sp. LABIM340]|uniref:MFS transporter n=1 Tax=Pseudomonas sp. LABIM340 TaxID=3156585 RepID=UPI0032AECD6B